MSRKRLVHEVELQSQQIKRVLAHHHVEAELATGEVAQDSDKRHTSFSVRAKLAAGWQQAQALARDLQQTLGQEVLVEDEDGGLKINLFQRHRPPVELLDVLEIVPEVPPLTAVLGWTAADRPVWLDLTSVDTDHVLLAGQAGAGKTTLLRTLALSLALNNRERELQLAIISVSPDEVPLRRRQALQPLGYLPHMLSPIATERADAQQLLDFLGQEAQRRQVQGITRPEVVLLVDHVDELLLQGGPPAVEAVTRLLRQGAPAGIHLVLSAANVDTAVMEDLYDAHIPARLVGQVATVEQAEIATDVYDSGAEQLGGAGDFLAILGDMMVHFQAAFVSDYDLHLCLEHLYTQRPPALLAQRFDPRPRPQTESHLYQTKMSYTFDWRAQNQLLHEKEDTAVSVTRISRSTPPPPTVDIDIEDEPQTKIAPDSIVEPVPAPEATDEQAASAQHTANLTTVPKMPAERSDEVAEADMEATTRMDEIAGQVEADEFAQPVPLPAPRPWVATNPSAENVEETEDDEIPFEWLAVEPTDTSDIAPEPAPTPKLPNPTMQEEKEATEGESDTAGDPATPTVNPAVRNLLKWRQRLPNTPRIKTSQIKPKRAVQNDHLDQSTTTDSARDNALGNQQADTAVGPAPLPSMPKRATLTKLDELDELDQKKDIDKPDKPPDDFDVLSEFSSADELKWLDEWDEMGDLPPTDDIADTGEK